MDIIIRTENLSKIYGNGEAGIHALNNVSISLPRGEFIAITGTSGSGKSTLMHLIGGLDCPSDGRVFYKEQDLYKMSDDELSKFRRQNIGFVFQAFNLIPELTARENIILPLLLDKKKPDEDRIHKLTDALGISGRLTHFPSQMSGGQQQRVAIARALSNDPEILLCDEPTGNLDAKSGSEVIELLGSAIKQFGKTVIIVTHDMDVAQQCDRIVKISDGEIAAGETA